MYSVGNDGRMMYHAMELKKELGLFALLLVLSTT